MEISNNQPAYIPEMNAPAEAEAPAEAAPAEEAAAAAEPTDQADISAEASNFEYQGLDLKDHYGANFWQAGGRGESGTEANRQINNDYAQLSQAADRYMRGGTGAPTLNNFFEYAEQASTNVGGQIRNLENLQQAAGGRATAAVDAGRSMLNGQQIDQARRVHEATRAVQDPNQSALEREGSALGQMWGEMDGTRDALVNGNTAIHRELGPAADAFFRGESDKGQGLQALRDKGIFPGSDKDPDGLVTRAFTSMQKVQELSKEWEKAGTPEEKERIQQLREEAAKDSTFAFMMHEQGHILQNGAIFDDGAMKRNLKAITPTMTFQDTHGTHTQLGEGQDYSNFKDRLGLKEVSADTPGAFKLKDHYYQPDPSQKGSIVDYFSSNMKEDRARPMIDAGARSLEAPPQTQAGRGIRQLAEGIDQGDFSTMTAGGIRGAGGAVTGLARRAGDGADQLGVDIAVDGVRQSQQGGVYNTAMGNAKMVGGVALHGAGQAVNAVGRVGGRAVDWTADAADSTINWTANAAKGVWGWVSGF